MKSNKKRSLKEIIVGAVLFLLVVGAIATIGFATNGFTERDPKEWSLIDVNEDNYIKVSEYEQISQKYAEGFTVNVKDNGKINVVGKNGTEETEEILVQNVSLKAGTYTFTSGVNSTSKPNDYHTYVCYYDKYLKKNVVLTTTHLYNADPKRMGQVKRGMFKKVKFSAFDVPSGVHYMPKTTNVFGKDIDLRSKDIKVKKDIPKSTACSILRFVNEKNRS